LLFIGEHPHAPVRQVSGKSIDDEQHSCIPTVPPVVVHRLLGES